MLEGAIMEYAKWFIGMICVMFIAVMVIFMFKMNEVNSFQQEVNYQIERHGGLTTEAKQALNEHAKVAYGGCLAASSEDNAPCLFPEPEGTKSSGFYVREYKTDDAGNSFYYDRGDDEKARYGTPVRYVISRQLLNNNKILPVKPVIAGTSSSRVRGTVGE